MFQEVHISPRSAGEVFPSSIHPLETFPVCITEQLKGYIIGSVPLPLKHQLWMLPEAGHQTS